MLDFPLLKKISETPGAPGFETQIRNLIKGEIAGLVDEMYIDTMGSLIGVRKGRESKKIMVAAHMDEPTAKMPAIKAMAEKMKAVQSKEIDEFKNQLAKPAK